MDDGPSAREFLEDDYDDDNEGLPDDEPLARRAQELRSLSTSTNPLPEVPEAEAEEPPTPPPKR